MINVPPLDVATPSPMLFAFPVAVIVLIIATIVFIIVRTISHSKDKKTIAQIHNEEPQTQINPTKRDDE